MSRAASTADRTADRHPYAAEREHPADAVWRAEALVEALGRTRSQAADEHLLNALPSLVGWLVGDAKWPRAGFAPLYRQLYTLVLLDERRTKAMLSALALPFEGLLRLGPDAATYREMIDEIRHALGLNLGSGVIDWLLELAELTVVYPCPRVAAREALWNVILSELIAVAPRLGRLRLDVLRDLAAVLGGAEVVHEIARAAELIPTRSDPTQQISPGSLSGKTVAIYTLTEAVGQRAAEKLTALFPGVRVEVSNDHVGSDRLRVMARNADLFVISWQSAKHAATEFIQANRPAALATMFAAGRGATSILRTVLAYVVG